MASFNIPTRRTQLDKAFFERDSDKVARDLLGRILVVERPRVATLYARLQEVAAYQGETDSASDGVFYDAGTLAVSVKYGKNLIDISTSRQGKPSCITLIAAEIRDERGSRGLVKGPGNLAKALDVDRSYDGTPLNGTHRSPIWIGGEVIDSNLIRARDLLNVPENWQGNFYFR